jgi:Flp pilus assembly protein TadG
MIMLRVSSPHIRKRRHGAALVEFAFVATVALMVFFGIFEYARFIFLLQVANNAAREGARYAVVHTGDGTTQQQIIDEVTSRMVGRDKELAGYTVEVFNVNPSTGATASNPDWSQSGFGEAIAVRISGNYSPILPQLLLTSSTVPVRVQAMMASEAN